MTCVIEGCDQPVKVKKRGLCSSHYQAWSRENRPRGKKPCSVEGCTGHVYAKGFCHNHYEVNRRMGTPTPVKVKKVCACGREAKTRGMCRRCYQRDYYKNGPLTRNGNQKGVVGYAQAHHRIRLVRGPVTDYTCMCGEQAEEWALRHTATNLHFDPNHSRPKAAYSLDVKDYTAMCRDCHRKYDALTKNRGYKNQKSRWDGEEDE